MADVVAATPLTTARFGRYDAAAEIASARFVGGSSVYIAIARQTKNNDAASSTRLALSYSPAKPTEATKTIQRPVAVKVLGAELTKDLAKVSRFVEAAQAATQVHHMNLLPIDEVGRDGANVFVVMDYIVGETVASLMRRLHSQGERLKPILAAHIIAEACSGLEAGHAAGILHGHLTPHDIFISYQGSVSVLDVGLAHARYELAGEQIDGVELEYASPERCNRETLDRRSDVFSLGVILWELLTGLSPFERPADVDVMRAIRDEAVMTPKRIVPGLPKEISDVTLKTLSRDRGERFQTAQALRAALLDPLKKAAKGQAQDAALVTLMKRLFPERAEQKRELVKRVEQGKPTTGLDFLALDRSTRELRPLPNMPPPPTPSQSMAPAAPMVTAELENRRESASIAPPVASRPPAFEPKDTPSVIIKPNGDLPSLVGGLPSSISSIDELPLKNEPSAVMSLATGDLQLVEEPEPVVPTSKNRGLFFAIAGVVVLLLIVGGVVVGTRGQAKPEATAAKDAGTTITAATTAIPPPVVSASAAPSADPVPAPSASTDDTSDTVVHIDTVPPGAMVWVDGLKRGLSPIDLHLPKGTAPVALELRHAGFANLHESVVPDVNQRLRLTLSATGVGKRPPAPAPSVNPYRKFE